MKPIPTSPRRQRAQGGLTRGGALPPNLFVRGQRGGLVLPLPDKRFGTPPWMKAALPRQVGHPTKKKKKSGLTRSGALPPDLFVRGQRGGLVLPLPDGRFETPLWMKAALLRQVGHPTKKKKKKRGPNAYKRRRGDPCWIPDHDDSTAFAQGFGFGRQRCLSTLICHPPIPR